MGEPPRIEDLRRRVDADPASIAFAQLAEELRRTGLHDEAVRVCRTGLARYPTYYSARVTLGRALLALGRLDEAQSEIDAVVAAAPDNLAALRTLADIRTRRGLLDGLPRPFRSEGGPAGEPVTAARVQPPMRPFAVERQPEGEPPSLAALEAWLAAILADRARRRSIAERS